MNIYLADKLIPKKSTAWSKKDEEEGYTKDIIQRILKHDKSKVYQSELFDFAKHIKPTKAGLRDLYYFVKSTIPYKEDPAGFQYIKSPARAYWDGRNGKGTDCKSFALFFGACLYNMGLDYKYRFTNYSIKDGRIAKHVYTVAKLPDKEIILDVPYGLFNAEKEPNWKKDYNGMSGVKIYSIEGINSALRGSQGSQVPKGEYIPLVSLTEGETTLKLMKRQHEILFHQGNDVARELEYLENIYQRGLHNGSNISGSGIAGDDALKNLALQLQTLDSPGMILPGLNSISGAGDDARRQYNICKGQIESTFKIWYSKAKKDKLIAEGCNKFITLEQVLNANLESTGSAMMYQFSDPDILEKFAAVKTKRSYQRLQRMGIQGVAGLSDTNMLLYLRNGLLVGLQEQPEDTIRKMAGSTGVGCVDPVTCTAVITAVVSGITALTKLINSFKSVGFEDEVKSVIEPNLSTAPDPDADFLSGKSGEPENANDEVTFWNKEIIPGLKNKYMVGGALVLTTGGIIINNQNSK